MSDLDPRIHAAIAQHRAGQLDQAAAIYAEILADNPASGAAMHLLGVIAHQRGDHARALVPVCTGRRSRRSRRSPPRSPPRSRAAWAAAA